MKLAAGSSLVVFVLVTLAACGDSSSSPAPCTQASTTESRLTAGTWGVTYTAATSGSGTLTSVRYTDAAGVAQTETPTGQTWNKILAAVPAGTQLTLTASGNPGIGVLSATIVSIQGATTLTSTDSCN